MNTSANHRSKFIAATCLAVVGLLSTLNIYISTSPISKACAGVMVVFVIVNLWVMVVTARLK